MNKAQITEWFFRHPRMLRFMANLYPPLFFSGIKILELSNDFYFCKVKLKNWPGTRNANGTQFGGSLFSMSDSVFGTMLLAILGFDKYFVWDTKSKIEFLSPGIGAVFLECRISPILIEEIIEHTKNGDKYFPTIIGVIHDKKGNEVAKISRTLYVRLKPKYRGNNLSKNSSQNTSSHQ